ncbi:Chromosome partitioning ATPase, Mrp family, contains Fe-S cluster [Aliiroseovarius halocynthiae]|uniref:non-specific protein-tyrosine kinase n=1 Tax=Aliiroseovarius halocynthiae TaxID=985055 RepID=A0A545SUM2_9RHOB|nr:AAA family ATPase [Aliiroseovarius halocynthiae]TQV68657.1 AAA family ATPase [Aliiroseovarius halocynthiae]SMR71077.1 Chromosome partitioning ATPase, Mrp family, contains Fe-S cluster [Aliiroseovarius halocynthiae]
MKIDAQIGSDDGSSNDFDRIGLDGFWLILRRHLRLIVLIVAAVIAATYFVVDRLEERFTARATLVLTGSDTRVRQTDTQLESFELSRAVIETEMDVLKSRAFADQLAVFLGLYDDPSFVSLTSNGQPIDSALHQEQVLDKIQGSYSVFRSGESLAIDIVATANAPALAADIANAIPAVYIENSLSEQRDNVTSSIVFLRERVTTIGDELTLAEVELADFIRDNKLDDAQLPDRLRSQVQYLTTFLKTSDADQNAENSARLQAELAAVEAELQDRTRAELAQMRRERLLEVQRLRYQTAIEKLNELETQINLVSQGARQVSVARPPVSASWPNKKASLVIAAVGGLVLAFIVALILDLMNRRLWNETQTMRLSGLPNAGFLPRIGRAAGPMRRKGVARYLIAKPHTMFAQAVRGATGLWFDDSNEGWVVMITSGLPHEGKSTVTVALGVSAALDGLRTLIIDMDSHREAAARLLDVTSKPAKFSDVIGGKVSPAPVALDGQPVEGLDFLSVNVRSTPNLKEQRQQLAELRKQIRENYDLVIVDTPPVLVVDDTVRIGVLADEIWQVVRWGRTPENVLVDTVERLKRDGLPITATLINDVDTRRHQKLGYGGYAQYYNYGEGYYS